MIDDLQALRFTSTIYEQILNVEDFPHFLLWNTTIFKYNTEK